MICNTMLQSGMISGRIQTPTQQNNDRLRCKINLTSVFMPIKPLYLRVKSVRVL